VLNKKLIVVSLYAACFINAAHAYNIYLESSGFVSPLVKANIYFEAIAGNYNKIASHQGSVPGKIGSWNWQGVKTPLGEKFKEHSILLTKITVNNYAIPVPIAFEVSGYIVIKPTSNYQVKVTCHKADHSITSDATYNYANPSFGAK